MKICLISEGSYPYVTGGVSNWVQDVMRRMPEHEFIVYSISAKDTSGIEPKYPPPPNLLEVRDVALDQYLKEDRIVPAQRYELSDAERDALFSLIGGSDTDWPVVFELFSSGRIDSAVNFLSSKDFLDVVRRLCLERFVHVPFTDMFWALRSMVLPLFVSIDNDIPEADLYHSISTGYAGVIGALAKHKFNKPLILTEHGIYTREREEEIIKAKWIKGYFKDIWIDYFYNLSHCAYQFANEVTSLFSQNRSVQIEIGCPAEKTSVIPNGIDTERFHPEERLKKDGIHIGAVVRVVPIKDIKTMIQSFAIVQAEIPEAHFYIIGPIDEDKEYYEECVELANNLGIQNLVFTGTVNVLDYLNFVDLLVLSSISEGQPLAILEGLAMGIPFVTTDVGSCSEIIYGTNDSFGPAGRVVPIMHFRELGVEILSLCRQPHLREDYGENGLQRVRELYHLPLMISRYKNRYERWHQEYGRDRVPTEGTV